MKMKKVIATAMVGFMAMGMLAGCGGGGAKDDAATAIKVGGTGPLTGGAAIYGLAVQRGAEIAVEEVNALGGVQFEFKMEDDAHDAEKAVNAYNALKDWGMQISLGSVTSTPGTATAAENDNDRIFALTPSASATTVTEGHDNVFQMCFADPNQGSASAQYIADQQLATKVGVIYKNDDVYSSGIKDTFVADAANYGIEIVAEEAFTADNKTDFTIQLQKAKEAGAELVFLPIYYSEAALILSQANSMGFAPMFFGCDGLDGILSVEDFDTTLAEGVMLLTPFAADADDDATKSFVAAYNEAYGETPIQFAADAYDAIYIIKAALEKAGATPEMSASELCEVMKTAMLEITVDGLTGAGMTWAEDGEVNKEPKAVKIVDGAYTAM